MKAITLGRKVTATPVIGKIKRNLEKGRLKLEVDTTLERWTKATMRIVEKTRSIKPMISDPVLYVIPQQHLTFLGYGGSTIF